MHHMDTDKAHGEKAWQQLHKNTTSHTEKFLEVTSYQTADVRPPTTHLKNRSNQTNTLLGT